MQNHIIDYYNLIGVLCEKEIDEFCEKNNCEIEDLNDLHIEDFLYDKYKMHIGGFVDLIKDLLPLIDLKFSEVERPKLYKGFSKDGFWIIKKEV